MPNLSDKRISIIVAYQGYQDYEFETVRNYLNMFGARIEIGSSSFGTAQGKFGSTVNVDYTLEDLHADNYHALIFIGGPGAIIFQSNQVALALARTAADQCQVLAAICIAPIILAAAGVLNGKKATVWSSESDRSFVDELIKYNVKYIDRPVVVDDKIITANGPAAADEFAEKIVAKLA